MNDPYLRLVELARHERELAASGDADGLATLERERSALRASLPDVPPEEVRPLLEEAASLQEDACQELVHAMASARSALVRVDVSSRTLAGYAPPVARAAVPTLLDRVG